MREDAPATDRPAETAGRRDAAAREAPTTPSGVSAETRAAEPSRNGAGESGAGGGFTRVASLDQLPEGTLYGIEIAGHRICLANVEGEIYALQDNCSHQDFPLSAGCIDDGRVECAWHGARFDPASGRAVALPAIRPVKTFDVRVDGNDVLVDLG